MIQILPDDLNRWLCAIRFLLRHVEIINENNAFLSNRRSIVPLSPLFHLAVHSVLRLIGACLCRKHQTDVLISVRKPSSKQLRVVQRLSCTRGA